MALIEPCKNVKFQKLSNHRFVQFLIKCFRTGLKCYSTLKKLDYLCNCKSDIEISNVCKAVVGDCLHAMKVVRHHANGRFDWLISGQQSINLLTEAISILSGKYKRFMFIHPVV